MRRAVFLALAISATTANAEPIPLAENGLRELATGKTVHLESPYGTLPVTFKADGTLSGKASGLLAAYLGSGTDRGRWSVQGDRICQKFFKWFHGETHCMRVKADGRRITWRRDDGLSGTATIAANDAAPPERPVGLGAPVEQPAPVIAAGAVPKLGVAAPSRFAAANAASTSDARLVTETVTASADISLKRVAPVRIAALPPDPGIPLASEATEGTGANLLIAAPALTPPPQALTVEIYGARMRHGWCQASGSPGKAAAADAPALLIVSRGGAPGALTEGDLSGCLAISPPLADIARARVGAFAR